MGLCSLKKTTADKKKKAAQYSSHRMSKKTKKPKTSSVNSENSTDYAFTYDKYISLNVHREHP